MGWSRFTTSWPVIAIATEGFTVASIETYKTFLFPNKPRGKFAGKPILHPEYLERRRGFVPVYAAIGLLVLGHLARRGRYGSSTTLPNAARCSSRRCASAAWASGST